MRFSEMKSADLKISLFIISYNQGRYLREAIESVLNQTLPPYEIIIVDDASADGSRQIIAEYALRHKGLIRAFYNKENLGRPETRNVAMEKVRGDLISYLDADDRFLPRKFELEAETYLANPEAKIVHSNIFYIDSKGRRFGLRDKPGDLRPRSGDVFCLKFSQDINIRNWLINYECFKPVGFFDPQFCIWSEWEAAVRLTKRYRVAYCPEPLTEYRIHEKGAHNAGPDVHLRVISGIYKKNRRLLRDVSKKEQIRVTVRLFSIMGLFAVSAVYAAIGVKRAGAVIGAAVRYWRHWVSRLKR